MDTLYRTMLSGQPIGPLRPPARIASFLFYLIRNNERSSKVSGWLAGRPQNTDLRYIVLVAAAVLVPK